MDKKSQKENGDIVSQKSIPSIEITDAESVVPSTNNTAETDDSVNKNTKTKSNCEIFESKSNADKSVTDKHVEEISDASPKDEKNDAKSFIGNNKNPKLVSIMKTNTQNSIEKNLQTSDKNSPKIGPKSGSMNEKLMNKIAAINEKNVIDKVYNKILNSQKQLHKNGFKSDKQSFSIHSKPQKSNNVEKNEVKVDNIDKTKESIQSVDVKLEQRKDSNEEIKLGNGVIKNDHPKKCGFAESGNLVKPNGTNVKTQGIVHANGKVHTKTQTIPSESNNITANNVLIPHDATVRNGNESKTNAKERTNGIQSNGGSNNGEPSKKLTLNLTKSNQNVHVKLPPVSSKLTSPSLYSLKMNSPNNHLNTNSTDLFVNNKPGGVSQSFSTTEVNRINLANRNSSILDSNFANKSLASIAMGSTDGKKLFIRRVPTSPSELLNLTTNSHLPHVMTPTGAITTSDEMSTFSSYSDSISDCGSHLKIRKRDHWTSKVQFVLACVGYTVGIGNLWRFPYLCYKSGGGVFLVPYFLIMFFCGVPLLYMELAVGQYTRRGPIGVLSKLCPIFKGAGISSILISFSMSTYYNVIIAYSLYYFTTSFRSQLPWQHCKNRWNTQQCWAPPSVQEADGFSGFVQNLTKPHVSKSPSEEFYVHKVLQLSSSVDEMGVFRWELVACSFVSYVIVYFALWKSVRSAGKVLYFTATVPFVLIFGLLIVSLSLEGSDVGLSHFFSMKFHLLNDHKIWVDAGAQVFNSIGIAYGAVITFSSYNRYNNRIIIDTLAVSIINICTSIIVGLFLFVILGNLSYEHKTSIDNAILDGPGLIFVVYSHALAKLPFSNFWAVFFFFFLFCVALNSQFAVVEIVVTSIQDGFPRWIKRYLVCHEIVVLAVCIVSFLCGLPYVTQGGIYIFQLIDHFTASTCVLYVAFFELIAIAWIYGADKLARNVHQMTGRFPSLYFRLCWSIAAPVIILAIWIFTIVDYEVPSYHNEQFNYPKWAEITGWIVTILCLAVIPITAVCVVISTEGKSFYEKLRGSFKCRFHSRTNSEDLYNKELKTLLKTPSSQIIIQPVQTQNS